MTDRNDHTAAALAKALPAGMDANPYWRSIAAFQADRLAEAGWVLVRDLADDERLVLIGEWACAKVDSCTCYGPGPGEPHEPHCGFEPIAKIDTQQHDAALLAAHDTTQGDSQQ